MLLLTNSPSGLFTEEERKKQIKLDSKKVMVVTITFFISLLSL
ncbi:MAG: preprotein translocase subunit Sec61beta [Anaerolineae bacterium]|nr:preprotein translocase subunit Sec61beta [Anaerolineae bacterium]